MPYISDTPSPSTASSTSSAVQFFPGDEKEKRRRDYHDADVVIIGAGVVGSALAVALGNQGRSVILLERSLKEPDRIVGELLQPGGVQALEKLGLDSCLEGIDGIPVHGYLVTYYGEPVEIPYPYNAGKGDGSRAEGKSFHHGKFVQALRMAAMKHDNVTVIESTATDLIKNEWTGQVLGVEATTKGKKDYYFGDLTVVCDGYASKFRKGYIRHTPLASSKFYGLEMKDAKLPKPYHGHVILGDGSPILLYQIGTHETRALIDVADGCPTAAPSAGGIKNHMRNVVVPALPECVRPAFLEAIDNSTIRSMPNSWLPPTVNKTPGMIIIGDALNMRHPLTGGGMTVGLNDVVLISNLLSPENVPSLSNTQLVMKQMKAFHWKRKDVTSVINILAQALYALFAASGSNLKALQMGCFRYFQFGGNCIDGPVGLLAGIIRNPVVLVYHFFRVAFVAIWVKTRSLPLIMQPFYLLFGGVSIFATAVRVIGPYIFAELRT
ncbi:uncharacterized protein PV09_06255 [Verruconis gallopava]|uniref:Squalene monooxygenase n=1 Tax=Verruconis gallopava TaxID=253628 RepID=A0A0D2A6T4_9PEZI|nr:uncharacterized protein PV09_06255 [Verruconis gallopava]KIW02443.1 hypothetical protein PV09_06255 [Verruconis gallopava]